MDSKTHRQNNIDIAGHNTRCRMFQYFTITSLVSEEGLAG